MSCSLYYRPIHKKSYRIGDYQLRDILEKRFGYPRVLRCDDIPYLEALSDAMVEGAAELVEAILKYDEIEIYKEC